MFIYKNFSYTEIYYRNYTIYLYVYSGNEQLFILKIDRNSNKQLHSTNTNSKNKFVNIKKYFERAFSGVNNGSFGSVYIIMLSYYTI